MQHAAPQRKIRSKRNSRFTSRVLLGLSNPAATTAAAEAEAAAIMLATPPMGWNSWNTFQTKIDVVLIEGVADTMLKNGMQEPSAGELRVTGGGLASEAAVMHHEPVLYLQPTGSEQL